MTRVSILCAMFALLVCQNVFADGPWRAAGHEGTYRVVWYEREGVPLDANANQVVKVTNTDETGVLLFQRYTENGAPLEQPVYVTFTGTWFLGYGSTISMDGMPGLARWRQGCWELTYRDGLMGPPVFPKWHATRPGDATTYVVLEPLTSAQKKEFESRREVAMLDK